MDIKVLNTSMQAIGVLDTAESVIWNERYNAVGDFEIYTIYSQAILNLLQEDYYLQIAQSTRTMIVEDVEIDDTSGEDRLKITGRSLESILERRIILRQIQIDTGFQAGVLAILTEDVIAGTYPERNIPNFIFNTSTDPLVLAPTLKGQYYSQNLLDTILDLCQRAGLGFKILFNASNQFVFSLYAGVDRSYVQNVVPSVVFSPAFDNLISSRYLHSKRGYKNFILVSGGTPAAYPGYPLRKQTWTPEVTTGLGRREMFEDVSSYMPLRILDTSSEIPDADYLAQLEQRGQEILAQNKVLTAFDGQIEVNLLNGYKYGTDFFLGDIIQMEDSYGHQGRSQITGITFSENLSEYTVYPTLKSV